MNKDNNKSNEQLSHGSEIPFNKDCSAFCPECKSDLYFTGNECICKNKDCNWVCTDCKTE